MTKPTVSEYLWAGWLHFYDRLTSDRTLRVAQVLMPVVVAVVGTMFVTTSKDGNATPAGVEGKAEVGTPTVRVTAAPAPPSDTLLAQGQDGSTVSHCAPVAQLDRATAF